MAATVAVLGSSHRPFTSANETLGLKYLFPFLYYLIARSRSPGLCRTPPRKALFCFCLVKLIRFRAKTVHNRTKLSRRSFTAALAAAPWVVAPPTAPPLPPRRD